ncbi:MAG: DUF6677 family protein [Planctomycetota bacterium]
MPAQRIDLKNPILAAALAWFVPGLGHAYQGRWFKAILYSACIWSTWFCGWALGDGKVVYYNMDMKRGRWTAGYAAQVMVGSAALPAMYQTRRASPPEDRSQIELKGPLSGAFDGALAGVSFTDGRKGYFRVRGQLEIQPSEDDTFRRSITGRFTGTVHIVDENGAGVPEGAPVEVTVNYLESLEPEIFPSSHRALKCTVKGRISGPKGGDISADLRGKVLNVRSLWNRYGAPLDAEGLEAAHGDLGKYFEIALVYTWIAGLLNLLAIWDAFEGPAYGYGDEEPADGKTPGSPPAPGTVVATTTSVTMESPLPHLPSATG